MRSIANKLLVTTATVALAFGSTMIVSAPTGSGSLAYAQGNSGNSAGAAGDAGGGAGMGGGSGAASAGAASAGAAGAAGSHGAETSAAAQSNSAEQHGLEHAFGVVGTTPANADESPSNALSALSAAMDNVFSGDDDSNDANGDADAGGDGELEAASVGREADVTAQ